MLTGMRDRTGGPSARIRLLACLLALILASPGLTLLLRAAVHYVH